MSMHDHNHSHHHHKHTQNTSALKTALMLTAGFMLIEIVGGYFTHSLALLSDGFHMLTDAAALAMSLFAFYIARRPVSLKRTFGFYRLEILAAFANGLFLIALSCIIIAKSWDRLQAPEEIKALETLGIATLGFLFNLYSVKVLLKADHGNLNVKGALFHVIGDLLGSLGAMTAAILYHFFGFTKADPIASILISILIIISAWKLIADTVNVMLEGAPSHINVDEVQKELQTINGVDEIHDLHVWCITSDIVSLTAHIVSYKSETQNLLIQIRELLKEKFEITHVTIQIERESLRAHEPHI